MSDGKAMAGNESGRKRNPHKEESRVSKSIKGQEHLHTCSHPTMQISKGLSASPSKCQSVASLQSYRGGEARIWARNDPALAGIHSGENSRLLFTNYML